ncbi:type II secretion system protein GspC, partial [Escherichia coli]|nr:type II secretion system protein GspC [Escherichia coli]
TSYVLMKERITQNLSILMDALEAVPVTFIRKINTTSVVFDTHGHYEIVTLHPVLPDIINQRDSEIQNVLSYYIIATPIRDGEQKYGLRLNPRKGLNALTPSLLHPGDIALGSII